MAGTALGARLALLLCAGLIGASRARQSAHTVAAELDDGQAAVKCGGGELVEWYATEGDFVAPGSPVCEICQPAPEGTHARSVTCFSSSDGYIVAMRQLSPGDSLRAESNVAVIQRQLRTLLQGVAVRCPQGAHFQQLIARPGERVRAGQAVALARTDTGEAVACRAPIGGRFMAAEPAQTGTRRSHEGRAVAYIKSEPSDTDVTATKTQFQLANPAPCRAVLVASGVQKVDLASAEVAVFQTSVAEAFGVGASDVVVSSISDLLSAASISLETTKQSEAQPREPENVMEHMEKLINKSLQDLHSFLPVRVRSISLSPHTPSYVRLQHQACAGGGLAEDGGHGSRSRGREEPAEQLEAPASQPVGGGEGEGDGERQADKAVHTEEPSSIEGGLDAYSEAKFFIWMILLAVTVVGSLCYYLRLSGSKRSFYRSAIEGGFFEKLEEPSSEEDDDGKPRVKHTTVVFEDSTGRAHNIRFQHSDHGMVLSESTPIAVAGFWFNSYAKTLLVQIGWRISKVDHQPVLSSDRAGDVYELLAVRLRDLPLWPLRIEFDTKSIGVKAFSFTRQPLGIELSEEAPVSIKLFKPDSHMEIRGVEVGWTVLRIGDMVVRPETSPVEVADWLEQGTAHLPQESGGLRADFLDRAGLRRTLCLRRQPLGIIFSRKAPVRVEGFEFNSYARELGVQVGWQLVRVGQQEISAETAPEDAERQLWMKVSHLAPWPLRMDFLTTKGLVQTTYVDRQPLGVDFTCAAPFKISCFKPDSTAKSEHWEVGWTVLRVGNGLLSEDTTYDVLMRYLDAGLSHLPPALPDGLAMTFVDLAGKARTLYFHRQPLGLVFDEHHPTTVVGFPFNSYARDLGVQAGWELTRVGEQDARACAERGGLQDVLRGLEASLAVWPVRMDFLDPEGEVHIFFFDRQPLGLEFACGPTVEVSALKPDSRAALVGVRTGWRLLRAGDSSFASGDWSWGGSCRDLDAEDLFRLLDKEVARLPQEPSGLRVDFADKDGRQHAMYFLRQPLGLRLAALPFAEGVAAEVAGFDFNSYAKDVGVQVGWRILRVGHEGSAPWQSLEALRDALRDHEADWPPWPLRMDFEPDDGSAVKVFFLERRSLGLELSDDVPSRVSSLDATGCAGACGVRPGWRVVRVGDIIVGHDMDREQLLAYISVGSAHLP